MTYIPKDWWMICDRCGGKFRYSDMKEEWTGLWVCTRGCWEPRHPQDFVEGVADDMTVPVARPDVANAMGETTLNGALSQWATTATLTSVSDLAEDDPVGILMDNGATHWTFIDDLAGSVVTMGSPLPWAAASGNAVYLPSLDNETWE